MRLKHIKGAEELMLVSPYVVQEPASYKGNWKMTGASRANEATYNKVFIEIGMGKGSFITKMAARDPKNLYIGIEKYSSVLIRGVQKQEELQLPNLRLIRMDAEDICEIFDEGEVDGIYLNFSDPWPKDRHAKRRLTSPQFLKRYKKILKKPDSLEQNPCEQPIVEFKTDNISLFDYSLESIKESGWEITAMTRDLHNDPVLSEGNIMTEYEEKFSSMGNPICKVCARP